MNDYINRDAALQAMWNALYALEDRQEAESGLDIMRRADVQAGFEAGQQVIAEFPAADVRQVVLCKDCEWWEKQKDSAQGRCALMGMYPTGGWFCANGKREGPK